MITSTLSTSAKKSLKYVQCSIEREYRPARQAICVVQVALVTSDECSRVTVREVFESGVNFLQLKRALACGVNSRAGQLILLYSNFFPNGNNSNK